MTESEKASLSFYNLTVCTRTRRGKRELFGLLLVTIEQILHGEMHSQTVHVLDVSASVRCGASHTSITFFVTPAKNFWRWWLMNKPMSAT